MLSKLRLTLNWWQAAIYESTLLALGLIIGSAKPELITGLYLPLWIIVAYGAYYILKLWLRQNRDRL